MRKNMAIKFEADALSIQIYDLHPKYNGIKGLLGQIIGTLVGKNYSVPLRTEWMEEVSNKD